LVDGHGVGDEVIETLELGVGVAVHDQPIAIHILLREDISVGVNDGGLVDLLLISFALVSSRITGEITVLVPIDVVGSAGQHGGDQPAVGLPNALVSKFGNELRLEIEFPLRSEVLLGFDRPIGLELLCDGRNKFGREFELDLADRGLFSTGSVVDGVLLVEAIQSRDRVFGVSISAGIEMVEPIDVTTGAGKRLDTDEVHRDKVRVDPTNGGEKRSNESRDGSRNRVFGKRNGPALFIEAHTTGLPADGTDPVDRVLVEHVHETAFFAGLSVSEHEVTTLGLSERKVAVVGRCAVKSEEPLLLFC